MILGSLILGIFMEALSLTYTADLSLELISGISMEASSLRLR